MSLYFLCWILLVVEIYAADKTVTVGNITTKVKGQSGKIALYKNGNESDGVTIDFSGIEEVDTIPSHTFQNFAKLDFEFSDLVNTTYDNSNVSVTQFSFKSNISIESKIATLTSYIYIFTSDGNITVDGTDFAVKSGEMKFNVKIKNWPFCGNLGVVCPKGSGTVAGNNLDFIVEIKGKKSPSATKPGKKVKYDLGDGASVLIPTKVIYDNTSSKDMPTGYPKLDVKGSKTVFVFRFEKFDVSALYDPLVSLGGDEGGSNETTAATTSATTSGATTEQSISASGVSAKVLGRSGKIELMNSASMGDAAKNRITVEFDNLQEMKSDDSAVKDNSHRFNTFANQDFIFQTPVDEMYPNTSIGVKRITFQSTLNNAATLKVYVYVFKADGQIKQENETTDVKAGNVKFNVEITSWRFCDGSSMCQPAESGAYLDFDIVIKGAGMAKMEKEDKYNIGSGMVMLSKKIKVDGSSDLQDMAFGYPKLVMQGSKQIFRFRFPKFTSSVTYDPTLILNQDTTNEGVRVAMATFWLAIICLMLQNI